MTYIVRGLIVGLMVPLLGGGMLASAGVAEASALNTSLAQADPIPVKLPGSELGKWPPTEQPVELVLRLDERQLFVYRGDTLEKSFPVAVGKTGWETPTGTFKVSYMLENPGWTNPFTGELMPPGPDNPLGERWIAFWTDGRNEIGFHGTPNRESIGQAASHGCVRLYNEHIRELYELVTPGTVVTVLP